MCASANASRSKLDGPANEAALAEARELAETLFSNSVIEDVVGVRFKSVEISSSSAEVAGETH